MTQRWRLRLAYCTLALVAGAQTFVFVTSGEPYPALLGPRFAEPRDRGGYIVEVVPRASFSERDGTRHPISPSDLVPDPNNPRAAIGRLMDRERMARPDMRSWVCRRLRALGAVDPVTFVVVAEEQTISSRTGELLRSQTADRIVQELRCDV